VALADREQAQCSDVASVCVSQGAHNPENRLNPKKQFGGIVRSKRQTAKQKEYSMIRTTALGLVTALALAFGSAAVNAQGYLGPTSSYGYYGHHHLSYGGYHRTGRGAMVQTPGN
jgi:hypothetical protein